MHFRLLLLIVLTLPLAYSLRAQSRLSGTQSFSGKSASWGGYQLVNWEIMYRFETSGTTARLVFYNPRVTVAPTSTYRSGDVNYTPAMLGLGSWPSPVQRPCNVRVRVQVSHNGRTSEASSSCHCDGSCPDTYNSFDTDKGASLPKVVAVLDMDYNETPDDAIDRLIEAKKNGRAVGNHPQAASASRPAQPGSATDAAPTATSGAQKAAAVVNATTPLLQQLITQSNATDAAKKAAYLDAQKWASEREAEYRLAVEKATAEIQTQEYFDQYFYPRVPQLLTRPAVPWATLLGSPVYADVFGKDVDYIIEHFKPTYLAKGRIKSELLATSGALLIETPPEFFPFFVCTVGMRYPSAPEVKDNAVIFVFDENNTVIGLKQLLNTPTTYNRCCATPIDEYLKALLQKMGDNYVPLSGNSYLLKNQLVVVDFDAIYLYDLSVLAGRGGIKLTPTKTNTLGLKIAAKPVVSSLPKPTATFAYWVSKHPGYTRQNYANGLIIDSVSPDTPGAVAGLQAGDVITEIAGIPVRNFTAFRLAVTYYGGQGPYSLTYRRAGQEQHARIIPAAR